MNKSRSVTSGRALWLRRTVSLAICLAAGPALAATVQQITSFGNNPTGIGMYLYTPNNAASHPPLLVGVHACHGKGTDVCGSGTPFAQQADKYGFLLVCPSAVSSDGCWDVHSNAVLTHNGGGDATGIISMVDYLIQNKNVDASRVYVAGHSSGGMMTNVLVGSYPDVFQAGAAFAGVPFACFAQGSVDSTGWNSSCANGGVTMTGAQWGNLVRNAYPGFSGKRPRVQLWHGTADATVSFHNFGEEIKEWTNVLGVSETPTTTENNAIQSSWIRTRYADSSGTIQVEAIQETGQPHNLVVDMADAVHFFGLDGSNPVSTGGAAGSSAAGGHGGGGAGGHGAGRGGRRSDGHWWRRRRRRRGRAPAAVRGAAAARVAGPPAVPAADHPADRPANRPAPAAVVRPDAEAPRLPAARPVPNRGRAAPRLGLVAPWAQAVPAQGRRTAGQAARATPDRRLASSASTAYCSPPPY